MPQSTGTPQPTVLVYRSELLPLSETFIKAQMQAYRRWRGILIGKRHLHGLALDGLDVRLLRALPSPTLSRIWWRICRGLGSVPSPVVGMLRREAPLLLHAHFGMDAVDAWPLARALDLPMLVTLHGYDITIDRQWWEAGHWGEGFKQYPRRLLELAAQPRVHFIAVSEAIRQRAVDLGIDASRISVRHIGIDVQRFAPTGRPVVERQRRILFVGRLVEKKGCEYLIRALAEVQAKVPDVTLVVVGQGGLQGELQQLARQLQVQAEFRGGLSSAEVQQELALARVFCLPSITAANGDAEGFGLVLLEAQASGVPVITSARGGSAEGVREGVTGLTFRERDVATLTSHLLTLLTDDNIAGTMACAGPHFVSGKFDILQCTQALEMLYDDMLKGEIASPPRRRADVTSEVPDAAVPALQAADR